MQKVFLFETQVEKRHIDLLGHMNNASYLELFEEARWHFIEKYGYGIEAVKKFQKCPIVLEANIKFKKEVVSGEIIRIESSIDGWSSRIGKINQFMYKSSGELASELVLTAGFFDLSTRKLTPITPEFEAALTGEPFSPVERN